MFYETFQYLWKVFAFICINILIFNQLYYSYFTPSSSVNIADAAPATYANSADLLGHKVKEFSTSYNFLITPLFGQCPDIEYSTYGNEPNNIGSIRRLNRTVIVPEEKLYLKKKQSRTASLWRGYIETYFGQLNPIQIQNIIEFYEERHISLAVSGGGWRSLLFGAGVLNAIGLPMFEEKLAKSEFDDGVRALTFERIRNIFKPSTGYFSKIKKWMGNKKTTNYDKNSPIKMSDVNRTSRISEFNLLSHVSGVSGGSWLISSLAIHDFPSLSYMINQVWVPWELPPMLKYVTNIHAKAMNGFVVGAPDQWANYLGTKLTGVVEKYGWHHVLSLPKFRTYSQPIPIITMSESFVFQKYHSLAPVWESSPFVTGSYSPYRKAFISTKYFGTSFDKNGNPEDTSRISGKKNKYVSILLSPVNKYLKINYLLNKFRKHEPDNYCVQHYDNVPYLAAISSGLFTAALSVLKESAFKVFTDWFTTDESLVSYIPNPFKNVEGTFGNQNPYVKLMDGGLTGQNLPLIPLLEPSRKIEMIYTVDASADDNTYPTGSQLLNNQEYAYQVKLPFPPIPQSEQDMILNGIRNKTTIFGCGSLINSNYTGPMLVYIPNYTSVFNSNTPTTKTTYTSLEVAYMIENGRSIALNMGIDHSVDPKLDIDIGVENTCMPCVSMLPYARKMNSIDFFGEQCSKCYKNLCYKDAPNDAYINEARFPEDPTESEELPLILP